MKKIKKNLFIFIVTITLLLTININFSFSEGETPETKEELLEKIETLNRILNEKFFIVQHTEKLTKKEITQLYISDNKTLIDLKLKLFYSLGKIYGYAVFINNQNDFSIIDNANLKISIFHKKYVGGKNTFFFKIDKNKFKKLILSRGDTVIAFPIDNILYGDELPECITIPVEAECLHLKSKSKIYIY